MLRTNFVSPVLTINSSINQSINQSNNQSYSSFYCRTCVDSACSQSRRRSRSRSTQRPVGQQQPVVSAASPRPTSAAPPAALQPPPGMLLWQCNYIMLFPVCNHSNTFILYFISCMLPWHHVYFFVVLPSKDPQDKHNVFCNLFYKYDLISVGSFMLSPKCV